MKLFPLILLCSAGCCSSLLASGNPNPPTWPSDVYVFTMSTPTATIQAVADSIFSTNGGQPDNGQFVNQGYALLFAPGTYTGLNINIGYYTSIIGLGANINDTVINSVSSPQGNNDPAIGALNSFWRSAENFSTTPAQPWSSTALIGMTWAVSQAAPLRRINVNGSIYLFQLTSPNFASGTSSGGFMADCTVTATTMNQNAIISGSQQQWCARNCDMSVPNGSTNAPWSNGVWNQVFVGCTGAPTSHCSNCPNGETPPCVCIDCSTPSCTVTCLGNPYTNIAAAPIIAEKPYITSNSGATSFSLVIPQVETNKIGTSQDNNSPSITVPFTDVFVATPSNTAAQINAQIASGNHVILTPGTYNLSTPIEISQPNIVVLGIGFPILISTSGQPCIVVGSVNGVRVGGVLLQAGPSTNPVTPTLLQWGKTGGDGTITSGFLYDCFTRTGRFSGNPNEPFNPTDLMVQINSANVVCDNLWLWRADHDTQGLVYNGNNACQTGAQINGNNVVAYGLACEHTLQDLAQWNGNNGQCFFFQAEFPYDVTASYGTMGYTGYKVGNSVTAHSAFGVGIYSFFRDYDVTMPNGIIAPLGKGIQFINALTRYLSGNGGISSVLNSHLGINTDRGPAVSSAFPGPAYLCEYIGQTVQPRPRISR